MAVLVGCGAGNRAADANQVSRALEAIGGIPQAGFTLGDPKAPWTLSVIASPVSYELDGLITQLPALSEQFLRSGTLKIQMRTPTRGPYGGDGDERAVAGALLAAGLQGRYWDALVRFVPRYVGEIDSGDLVRLLRRSEVPDVRRAMLERSSERIRLALNRADAAAAAAGDVSDQSEEAVAQGQVVYMLAGGEAEAPRYLRLVQKRRSLSDEIARVLRR